MIPCRRCANNHTIPTSPSARRRVPARPRLRGAAILVCVEAPLVVLVALVIRIPPASPANPGMVNVRWMIARARRRFAASVHQKVLKGNTALKGNAVLKGNAAKEFAAKLTRTNLKGHGPELTGRSPEVSSPEVKGHHQVTEQGLWRR